MARLCVERLVRLFLSALALLLGAAPAAADAAKEVVAIHIVSSVDGALATDRAKRARKDESVQLHAVLEVVADRKTRYYASVASFKLGKKKRTAKPLSEAPTHFVFWHTVEPTLETMSNTASGKFAFEPIEYDEALSMVGFGRPEIKADVRPTLTPDRGDGVGTMRFKASVITEKGLVESAGASSRAGRGSGGLDRTVHRITIRTDDSYLGFLSELYGQPYIWASAGRTDKSHQSERLEGSDCADFVVYGWRRMGRSVPYTWTGGLPDHTRLLGRGEADESGVYRDADGNPIPFPKVGDIALFPRHVGVLTDDRGTIGALDHEDIMMHSYFASPREQSLGDSDYANTWLEVRRLK